MPKHEWPVWVAFWIVGLFCPSMFSPLAAQGDHPLLAAGPMIGHTDYVEVTLWLQTKQPAQTRIEYWVDSEQDKQVSTVKTEAAGFLIAKHLITALADGQTYHYQLFLDGQRVHFPYPLTFKTPKIWRYRGDAPDVRFAIGSCFYVNDPPFDRPGDPYGRRFDILNKILAKAPDFMIWMGDNVYLREGDFTTARMNYRYAHSRALPELQPLLAGMAHYAIWDDHDFGPNDSNRSFELKGDSLALFKAYWANPNYGLTDAAGIFGKLSWSDLDFFFMDDRYHRAPNRLNDPDKPYFGKAQLDWLKDALASSHATFKFIVNGNQFLNGYSRFESFAHYQNEHSGFMAWLANSGIEGVVVLSGDRHFTELLRLDRPAAYPLFELTNSPLTSGMTSGLGSEKTNPLQVKGTRILDMRNFGLLEVTGKAGERLLTISVIDADGRERWRHQIHEKDLRPAAEEETP